MKIVLLGTGGYHPNERRHTACVMLPEIGVVLDAGTSAFRIAERLETTELDVFLTHAHLDHIAGLTYLLVPLLTGQLSRIGLHADDKTLSAVKTHLFAEAVFPVLPDFDEHTLTDSNSLPGGGTLTSRLQQHPGGSLGFRLDFPECSLAYLTDVHQDGSAVDFIRDVDLLIHEANFPDEQQAWARKTGHSTPTPVAKMARDAGVGRLILTHIDPQQTGDNPFSLDSARSFFPNITLGEDNMVIEL